MRFEAKYVTLHTPLFLAGTNLSDKLDINKRTDIKLVYDSEDKELYVIYNQQIALVLSSNIASIIPKDVSSFGFDVSTPAQLNTPVPAPSKPIKAQASTPQDHVFAGEK